MPWFDIPDGPRARLGLLLYAIVIVAVALALAEAAPEIGRGLAPLGGPRPSPMPDPSLLVPEDPWRWAAAALLAVAGLALLVPGRRIPSCRDGGLASLRKVFRPKGASRYAPACRSTGYPATYGGWGSAANAERWLGRGMGPACETEEPGYRLLAGVLHAAAQRDHGRHWAELNDRAKAAFDVEGEPDLHGEDVYDIVASGTSVLHGRVFRSQYARTACLDLLGEAREVTRVPSPELSWVAGFDVDLYHALSGLGRPSVNPSALGALDHHAHESAASKPLPTPHVANAAKALAEHSEDRRRTLRGA